jgi:ceramide glucosyltransferase
MQSHVTHLLYVLLGFSWYTCLVLLASIFFVRRRTFPQPTVFPPISILKPMAGDDDDLLPNLESHLDLDYPGEYEILLGVRSTVDTAYPVAKAFAEKYAHKHVRLVLQEGEPGLNPKVNQLITLTRHARYEHICITDANVRVQKNFLREHATVLGVSYIGLSTNAFVGVGEESVGAALDNMTSASFCAACICTGEAMGANQIVGKCLVVTKTILQRVGGWEDVKDLLAEDQRMGRGMAKLRIRTTAGPTFVQNVQRARSIEQFWDRYSRWAMLRFLIVPGFWLEPMLIPTLWGLILFAARPSPLTAALAVASAAWSAIFTQICMKLTRGHGTKLKYLVLAPVRDVLQFGTWLRGCTLRTINWRGNVLRVGANTTLSLPAPPQSVVSPSATSVQPVSREQQ